MDRLIKGLFLLLIPFLALIEYELALDDVLMARYLFGSLLLLLIFSLMLVNKIKFYFSRTALCLWAAIYATLVLNWFTLDDHNYWLFIFSKLNFLFSFNLLGVSMLRKYSIKALFLKSILVTLIFIEVKVLFEMSTLQIESFNDVFQINGGFGHKNILSIVLFVLSIGTISLWNGIVKKWMKYSFITIHALSFSLLVILQTRSVWLIIGVIICSLLLFKRAVVKSHYKAIATCLCVSILFLGSFFFCDT